MVEKSSQLNQSQICYALNNVLLGVLSFLYLQQWSVFAIKQQISMVTYIYIYICIFIYTYI